MMQWTIGVTWEDGTLEGPTALVDWILEFSRDTAVVSPIFGVDIRSGLEDPLEAWATITEALRWIMGRSVEVPEPPVPIHGEPGYIY